MMYAVPVHEMSSDCPCRVRASVGERRKNFMSGSNIIFKQQYRVGTISKAFVPLSGCRVTSYRSKNLCTCCELQLVKMLFPLRSRRCNFVEFGVFVRWIFSYVAVVVTCFRRLGLDFDFFLVTRRNKRTLRRLAIGESATSNTNAIEAVDAAAKEKASPIPNASENGQAVAFFVPFVENLVDVISESNWLPGSVLRLFADCAACLYEVEAQVGSFLEARILHSSAAKRAGVGGSSRRDENRIPTASSRPARLGDLHGRHQLQPARTQTEQWLATTTSASKRCLQPLIRVSLFALPKLLLVVAASYLPHSNYVHSSSSSASAPVADFFCFCGKAVYDLTVFHRPAVYGFCTTYLRFSEKQAGFVFKTVEELVVVWKRAIARHVLGVDLEEVEQLRRLYVESPEFLNLSDFLASEGSSLSRRTKNPSPEDDGVWGTSPKAMGRGRLQFRGYGGGEVVGGGEKTTTKPSSGSGRISDAATSPEIAHSSARASPVSGTKANSRVSAFQHHHRVVQDRHFVTNFHKLKAKLLKSEQTSEAAEQSLLARVEQELEIASTVDQVVDRLVTSHTLRRRLAEVEQNVASALPTFTFSGRMTKFFPSVVELEEVEFQNEDGEQTAKGPGGTREDSATTPREEKIAREAEWLGISPHPKQEMEGEITVVEDVVEKEMITSGNKVSKVSLNLGGSDLTVLSDPQFRETTDADRKASKTGSVGDDVGTTTTASEIGEQVATC